MFYITFNIIRHASLRNLKLKKQYIYASIKKTHAISDHS